MDLDPPPEYLRNDIFLMHMKACLGQFEIAGSANNVFLFN